MPTPALFEPITFRSVTVRNRIAVSPMCQYSAVDGLGDDWHVQHLGAKAAGGAGIVFTEATHVSAVARISAYCLGLWNAQHQALLARVAAIITRCGAVPGIQLAHAGRKASTRRPWDGGTSVSPADGGWVPLAPSPIPFVAGATDPTMLTPAGIAEIAAQFAPSARWRARPASRSPSCTPRTATCCIRSCRRSPTTATTPMAATSTAGRAS
jgi:2,4-dienoyl-CoA reductase-like NADH-dependent reductase (Old Yellow Enzyme family)